MQSDDAWAQMERTAIALLRDAFSIRCYVTHDGNFVFVDQDLTPQAKDHNVWRFTPQQWRECVKAATKKGTVTHEG